MKKIKLLVMFAIVLFSFLSYMPVHAASPIDEITEYTVIVDVRDDGTLDIYYDFIWHVVEDDGEALTYVDFGIPNKHVDEIKSRSRDTIDIIEFTDDYHNNDGAYVKILLKDEYYEGSYIHIAFSIHQSYMYRILEDDQQLRYNFTPGWFNEMKIQKLIIKWNADQVEKIDGNNEATSEGSYYVWTKENLDKGERYPITVYYDRNAYDVNESEQAEDDLPVGVIIIIIIVIIIVIVFVVAMIDDEYNGGFGGGVHYYSSCVHSSCASSCACACACACAGGGRAGCSKKDFYKGSVDVRKLNKILTESFFTKFSH